MGKRKKTFSNMILAFLGLMLLVSFLQGSVSANGPDNGGRTKTDTVTLVIYQWQMKLWSDSSVVCKFALDHPGQPSDDEIQENCNAQRLQTLQNTPKCNIAGGQDSHTCEGVYLYNLNAEPLYKTVTVTYALPSVWISLSGCEYTDSEEYCSGEPSLVFTGKEPLPNEHIDAIKGKIGDRPFTCTSDKCTVDLEETGTISVAIEFQGQSSYGDRTPSYSGSLRVIQVPNKSGSFYIQVASDQWLGKAPPSCSDIWNVFPDSVELPEWLQTPENPADLTSSQNLYYLAAQLIINGQVNASNCQNNGLADQYTASECGVAMAGPQLQEWQNKFNDELIVVAKMDGIPAALMKNIFLKESQLWPGIYGSIDEVGFGHMTEYGADTLLLWNSEFFDNFCPLVLNQTVCDQGYAQMSSERKYLLIGALLNQANASCPECDGGVDLTKADFSIHIFAEALKANCRQVSQEIYNNTQKYAYSTSSYLDLWRFTLLNYNAGAGCLSNAIYRTKLAGDPIDWSHVAANLPPVCQGAADYVVDVTGGDTESIDVFSTPFPSPTPTWIGTPTLTLSTTATPTQ